MNEGLTPARSQLAMKARQAVKEGQIHSTWTLDGNLYVKKNAQSRPKKIQKPRDLKENTGEEHKEEDLFGGEPEAAHI